MRIRFLVLAILLCTVSVLAGAQQTITVGFWDNGPYVVGQPGGQPPIGSAVDYWNTIVAPAMHVTTRWEGPTPLLRLLKQLQTGEIDAVLIVGKNPEREKLFQFPAVPYLHFQPGVALRKDNPLTTIKSADDVSGMKIGYVEGAVVVDFMKNANVTWDKVTTATWIQDQFPKLANKRIDAVLNLTYAGLQFEAAKTFPDKFKFLALPVPPSDIYTAFAKTDKATEFLKLYNDVNAKNASAGDTLVKKYIN
jgi:ABC-type amino acid transport substrate-binding protein